MNRRETAPKCAESVNRSAPKGTHRPHVNASMADEINIKEVSGCICLRLRRAARQVSQIYDRELQPAGVTVNQFGVLAILYGSSLQGHRSLAVGTLANRIGKHATTLNRDLKLLRAQGLVSVAADPADHRVHA